MQVESDFRYTIGRGWRYRRFFIRWCEPRPVELRGANLDKSSKVSALPKRPDESNEAHTVGLVESPIVRIPRSRPFSLGGEIDDVIRLEPFQFFKDIFMLVSEMIGVI